MLEISIPNNKQINQMTTKIMTFNEFIAGVARIKLMDYIWDSSRKNSEKLNRYVNEGDYQVHLEYLIDTWKNLMDEYSDKIDYDRQGTCNELRKYITDLHLPRFDYTWVVDIFERKILDTNVCLK
jgi:hypothetical protein